jgi:hypothetical protein
MNFVPSCCQIYHDDPQRWDVAWNLYKKDVANIYAGGLRPGTAGADLSSKVDPFMVLKLESQPGYPESFGERNFGQAQLGDRRRTRRLVRVADTIARHPGGTLPDKLKSPAELEALYHLMNCKTVTHQSVLEPHRLLSLERIRQRADFTLVIHDTTELDFTAHESLGGELGQIGNGNHKGYLCHNSLAVDPSTREVIGLTNQILHRRADVQADETQIQRRERENRESRLWLQGTQTLPASDRLVDVCDRGADTFEFLEHEVHSGRLFVIRSCYNRSIYQAHNATAPRGRLHDFARTLEPLANTTTEVTGRFIERKVQRKGKKTRVWQTARTAQLCVAAAPILLRAPTSKNGEHGNDPLPLWIVRVWEPNPPEGEKGLEWFLLTNRPIITAENALETVSWYECRWIIEEFHKAAKTGCGIENPQFTSAERLQPMIALLSVVALTLLNLRELSRHRNAKMRPATDVVSVEYVRVLSVWRHGRIREDWTIHDFFFALARLGGHQNRKRDHHPGWLVLWRGWSYLQAMLAGVESMKNVKRSA